MEGRQRAGLKAQIGLGRVLLAAALIALPMAVTAGPVLGDEDASDHPIIQQAVREALETKPDGWIVPWTNPQSGNSGEITVLRTFFRETGPCRDYRRTTLLEGAPTLTIEGQGCRRPDATWSLDESPPKRAEEGEGDDPATPSVRDSRPGEKTETADDAGKEAPPTDVTTPEEATAEAAEETVSPPLPKAKPETPTILVRLPQKSED